MRFGYSKTKQMNMTKRYGYLYTGLAVTLMHTIRSKEPHYVIANFHRPQT